MSVIYQCQSPLFREALRLVDRVRLTDNVRAVLTEALGLAASAD